jgi:hypothetical protein
MVSSSTFASEMRTSPAMTRPLSRTRSRMSIRLVGPATLGKRSMLSLRNCVVGAVLAYTLSAAVRAQATEQLQPRQRSFAAQMSNATRPSWDCQFSLNRQPISLLFLHKNRGGDSITDRPE